jgi:hypothetical protein
LLDSQEKIPDLNNITVHKIKTFLKEAKKKEKDIYTFTYKNGRRNFLS